MINYTDCDIESLYKSINDTNYEYPKNKTIWQLFKEQVERTPDMVAVIIGQDNLTYRQLYIKASQIAELLRSNGVGRNRIVGVVAERSLEMIIGIYGILSAGAAYLPISPDCPAKRLEYMIFDSGIDIVLTQSKFSTLLKKFPVTYISLDSSALCDNLSTNEFCNEPDPRDMMYVTYTSGSTGNPKGVMIDHYSVVNRLNWMQKRYPLTDVDTILQKTPFVFDVSVWELFWWAITGARLCLLEPSMEKFPQAIIEACHTYKVTVMHFVPSMLNVFVNYISSAGGTRKLSSVKRVFCSGETLSPNHVHKFYQTFGKQHETQLVNLYGPTEATIDVLYYDCPCNEELKRVPVGKPIDNTQIYIMRDNKRQPVGEVGELVIAGDGLARGYLNAPELTNKKFVDNPFAPGQKIYLTGDSARLLPDGNFEFLGRLDNQVKIRGLRIELGEIEARICQHPSVEQCAVLVKNAESLNPSLTAYILTQDQTLTKIQIKEFIQQFLPDYMIPNGYVMMDHFPTTQNGKLDRKALSLS